MKEKIRVALLSTGLGNISRGFEITTNNWFTRLERLPMFSVRLFSGGKFKNATQIWNFSRNGIVARCFRRLHILKEGFRFEQVSFGICFLFYLLFYKPDVIWIQEVSLGNVLIWGRKLFGFKYKIIFCDGAPMGYPFVNPFDYVIFLHRYAYDEAVMSGIDPQRCRVIPYITLRPKNQIAKEEARKHFDIPTDKFVIICVAAWNTHHKRIDYLLREFSKLSQQDYYLLLCGQPEEETESLKRFAGEKVLNVKWLTLPQDQLSIAYSAADLFVLPSLNEGLGAVIIEAAFHALPIICHPHPGGKFILGEDYDGLTDLSEAGNLSARLKEFRENINLDDLGSTTKSIAISKFDEQVLVSKLQSFIVYVSAN